MAFIEPMHRNKPNITYLLTHEFQYKLCAFYLFILMQESVWVTTYRFNSH